MKFYLVIDYTLPSTWLKSTQAEIQNMVNFIDDKWMVIYSVCIATAQIEEDNILKLSFNEVIKHSLGVDF